jgi:hypothetical protein
VGNAPSKANLLAAFNALEGKPSTPAMLLTFTIVPDFWARIIGSTEQIRRRDRRSWFRVGCVLLHLFLSASGGLFF